MERKQGPTVTEQLIALGSAAAMVWVMMPAQERFWLSLRTVALAHRVAARLARAEGRAGMGQELSGRDPEPWYGTAVLAGHVRDALGRHLERMKP
jgi:hypothetical protein